MRNQYTFYKSFDDVAQELNDIQLAKYVRTLNDVQFLRVKIDDVIFDDPILNIVWKSQKHSIETSIKGYLDSQKNKNVKNPYIGVYGDTDNPYEGVAKQGQVKEQEQGQVKEQEQVQLKERVQEDNKINPKMCIELYKDKISNDFTHVREQTSFNQLALLKNDLDKIYNGILNFSNSNTGIIYTLPNFLKDKIYMSFQEVKNTTNEKTLVPKTFIGKDYTDLSGNKWEFRKDGVYSVSEDFLYFGEETIKGKIQEFNSLSTPTVDVMQKLKSNV